MSDFDAWLATFAQPCRAIELAPAGGFRIKSRFARFHNVPEMLQLWLVSGDVKTAEDLNLDVPHPAARVRRGPRPPRRSWSRPPPSRSTTSRTSPTGPRRCAAAGSPPTRTTCSRSPPTAARPRWTCGWSGSRHRRPARASSPRSPRRSSASGQTHRDDVFLDKSGRPAPGPGRLPDRLLRPGHPERRAGWNVYDELRDLLAAGGVPREQIRFIHEAGNDQEKAELFAACRDGRVAVLLGSTEKMGVGTNVQDRLGALHHLDCPWRPADLAQRLGRIIRQGNQNTEVAVLRYVTEGTFDAYMWQTVTRKAIFIAQVMRGRLDVREIDDIGDQALTANEVKALATGDPLILDKAQADADLTRLERLKRAHDQTRHRLRDTIRRHERSIEQLLSVAPAEGDGVRRVFGGEDVFGARRSGWWVASG